MNDEPDYIVIHDPDRPGIDGTWYDRSNWEQEPDSDPPSGAEALMYVPTGEFEHRADGAVAQVFRPQHQADVEPG